MTSLAAAAVLAGAGATYAVTQTSNSTPTAAHPPVVGTLDSLRTNVPAALAVPAGQHLVASADVVQGSQVYTCGANGAWTLLAPEAVLSTGQTLILHNAGPQWTSALDGSSVTGKVVASVPRAGAVPELLLKATANHGTGLLGHVDFVQRLDTSGGVAPTTACVAGQQQAVNYRATYRFFAPSSTSTPDE